MSHVILPPAPSTAPKSSAATVTQFNVKDFGAVGDGTTDDTEAIQAAIDAALRSDREDLP